MTSAFELKVEDIPYLEVVERAPFCPTGWLYRNVYEGLVSRGLVFEGVNGFSLTEFGYELLMKSRQK